MSNLWDEFEPQTESTQSTVKKKFNRIDFDKPETQIRILSDTPAKRMYHFVKTSTSGAGKPVICCGDGCPVCATGNAPSPKWLFPALNRNTLEVGVVQLSMTIMKSISRLRKLPMFGPNIKSYDILIIKDVTKGRDGKKKTSYQVQGIPKAAVDKLDSETTARIIEELKQIDIESVAMPYSPEQTMKYLGWSMHPVESGAAHIPSTSKLTSPVAQSAPRPQSAAKSAVEPDQDNDTTSKPGNKSASEFDIEKFLHEDIPGADESYSMESMAKDDAAQDDSAGDPDDDFSGDQLEL